MCIVHMIYSLAQLCEDFLIQCYEVPSSDLTLTARCARTRFLIGKTFLDGFDAGIEALSNAGLMVPSPHIFI